MRSGRLGSLDGPDLQTFTLVPLRQGPAGGGRKGAAKAGRPENSPSHDPLFWVACLGRDTFRAKCCPSVAVSLRRRVCSLDKPLYLVIICVTIGGIDVSMFRVRLK